MRQIRLVAALCLAAACQGSPNDGASGAASVTARLDSLERRVRELERDQGLTAMARNAASVAYLTPGTDGYAVVRSDIGHLTVSFEDVQAYATGSKVTLSFGNTTAAAFKGAHATVEWGSVDANGLPIDDAVKSREISFEQVLDAGAWTNVMIVLEGVPPSELGFVRIRDLSHAGIQLAGRRP